MKYSKVKKTQTRQDFIPFLRTLKKDYTENLSTRESRGIETFLGAVASWIEDVDGFI